MNKPIVVIPEPQYRKGFDKLKKQHKYNTLRKLADAIKLLEENKSLPTSYKPHKLKGVNQFECHIDADVLLTWRYEEDKLVINLRLLNLTDHDSLNRKSKIHGSEDDWDRRWDDQFSKYDNVPLSIEEFKRIREEMHNFK